MSIAYDRACQEHPEVLIDSLLVWFRQCSSGLQAVADVAAAIRAGFYTVGLAGGVEAMSQNPMAWEGGVNPRAAKNKKAMSCLIPMGTALTHNLLASLAVWLLLPLLDFIQPHVPPNVMR